jgi:hypothetical protein
MSAIKGGSMLWCLQPELVVLHQRTADDIALQVSVL